MSEQDVNSSRRRFLSTAGAIAAVTATNVAPLKAFAQDTPTATDLKATTDVEPFYGLHQSGIVTPAPTQTYFAAFDVTTTSRTELQDLLKNWTRAAERMSRGLTAQPLGPDLSVSAEDSGEALGLNPSKLTLTFGFGPSLFSDAGHDRFGLNALRPAGLPDMPVFTGDQLIPAWTGGDLSVQACSDDPQVAFHSVRQLANLGYGKVKLRWVQAGFQPQIKNNETPRNLMGFKDGTQNPTDAKSFVWVSSEGPAWMEGGTYLAVRKIRIALEHWDRTPTDFQEQVIGRHKLSGAPLGQKKEKDALDLDAKDADGNPVIPDTAHVRLGSAAINGGAQILRRGFSYNDGANVTAERWPPWRQGLEYDCGSLFFAYQRDLRTGFIPIFENMSKLDTMNQFTTHVGGGFFACPRGATAGTYIGQELFR